MTEASAVMWASVCCLSLEFPCGICRSGVNRGGRLPGGESGQQIVSKNIFQKMDTVFIKVIVLKIYLWAILFKVYMIMARNSVCEEFFKHFEN